MTTPTPPRRAWIDAPSTLQPEHHLHGTLGLVIHDYGNAARFYPVSGPTESLRVSWSVVVFGWPGHRTPNAPTAI